MLPIRRDLRFPLPADRVRDWHPAGRHISQFFNALSLFFPDGERFFIHSVRHFRERIRAPELQQAVTAFIGQEAMHGREHEEYNALLAQAGLPVEPIQDRIRHLLEQVKRRASPVEQLAATIALEHLTAILADHLLREPQVIAGADETYAALWRWHALEETEHKAVAFDVYCAVAGRGVRAYLTRAMAMLSATAIFMVQAWRCHRRFLRRDGLQRDWRGRWRMFKFLWLTPGTLRKVVPAWLDYFRPGFHPWQHDNRYLLSQVETIAERYAQPG